MTPGLQALTEKEREALRLLVAGHDAKSMAHKLGLSVHTINDRLREARRKLGVTSSREAARQLAASETGDPQFLADKQIGEDAEALSPPDTVTPATHPRRDHRIAWIAGGMLMMSLFIAASFILPAVHQSGDTDAAPQATDQTIPVATAKAESVSAAQNWIALLDKQDWSQSWDKSGGLFRSSISKAGWASKIRSVREPLGAVGARKFRSATRTGDLPGAPAGDYEVLEFLTDFASKKGAIETVVLAREPHGWRVVGYFIR